MNVIIVCESKIPALLYGGTERMIWWLGKELVALGHSVTYLVDSGSECHFAKVIFRDSTVPVEDQIPEETDVVHFLHPVPGFDKRPNIQTIQGNYGKDTKFSVNSVFVSGNHAQRHNAEAFVYNCLDPEEFGKPDFNVRRDSFHFLGKAAWRLKNVKGAINVATKAGERLDVLGGTRLNFKMGFRFTPNLNVRFRGMVGGEEKNSYLRKSKGLIFPVRWHEPFGIALIESLYFGCPVFGTPYGSLPEIVTQGFGVLSDSESKLAEAVKAVDDFDRKACHEYICDRFLAKDMAKSYLALYEKVAAGASLNKQTPCLLPTEEGKFLPWNE
jgi:glycosyltransferase involved in cell wall biosynthesis